MKRKIIVDIETAPLPEAEVAKAFHYPVEEEWEDPGEFDPGTVKLGNLKDEAKIAAKIAAAKEEWDRMRQQGEELSQAEYQECCADFIRRATLSAATGQIFGVVVKESPDTSLVMVNSGDKRNPGEERELVKAIWNKICPAHEVYGWNFLGFDLRFLIGRTILLGLELPIKMPRMMRYSPLSLYCSFGETHRSNAVEVIDLQQECWKAGISSREKESLAYAAHTLGVESKMDRGGLLPHEMDHDTCVEYTRIDGEVTWMVGAKLGFLPLPEPAADPAAAHHEPSKHQWPDHNAEVVA